MNIYQDLHLMIIIQSVYFMSALVILCEVGGGVFMKKHIIYIKNSVTHIYP